MTSSIESNVENDLQNLLKIYQLEGRSGLSAKEFGMLVLNDLIDDDFNFGSSDC